MDLKNGINSETIILGKVLRISGNSIKTKEQEAREIAGLLSRVDKGNHVYLISVYLLCCSSKNGNGPNNGTEHKVDAETKAVSSALAIQWGKTLEKNIVVFAKTSRTVKDAVALAGLIFSSINKRPDIVDCDVAALLLASFLLRKHGTIFS